MKNKDEEYMRIALKEAEKAKLIDEVPIGCVIVVDDKIIAKAHNLKEKNQCSFAHAEIIAIQKASKKLNSWRLDKATLYVTIEPCFMCAGAIYQARIKRVVYGARDVRQGGIDSALKMYEIPFLNHYPYVKDGVLEKECSNLIKEFFKNKRKEHTNQ